MSEVFGEVIDGQHFFAPASTDLIDGLIGSYKMLRVNIEMMAELVSTNQAAVGYFLRGNKSDRDRSYRGVADIFQIDGAIASLNADFWQRALNMTDVYEYMPNNRRQEWQDQLSNPRGVKAPRLQFLDIQEGKEQQEWTTPPLPDFEEEAVRPSIMELLNSRQKFFSERVDGIFRALSGDHVTNRPEGFGKRMILARVFNDYGHTEYRTAGYIQDLRQVVAKFMGRDEPKWKATDSALYTARARHGEWLTLDGGAFRVRAYLKGTAHLEVHPEMAWRLNCILAHLYPMAIPAEFRQKPKRKIKDFVMMGRPLPFAVLGEIAGMKVERHVPWRTDRWDEPRQPLTTNPFNRSFSYGEHDKAVRAQAEKVIESLGGVKVMAGAKNNVAIWEFDYDPSLALSEVLASGCIPDKQSHQFYPTPQKLAEIAIELAEIDDDSFCLEPSAGIGGLADFMPKGRTVCVEISKLHCMVLESKGFNTVSSDFMVFAEGIAHPAFDRVIMNPPFSEGRAKVHVEVAAKLVKERGRLVAILPAGMRNKPILPEWRVNWSQAYDNEFDGTSVSVVILTADRKLE